jgi:hypothetical protein
MYSVRAPGTPSLQIVLASKVWVGVHLFRETLPMVAHGRQNKITGLCTSRAPPFHRDRVTCAYK